MSSISPKTTVIRCQLLSFCILVVLAACTALPSGPHHESHIKKHAKNLTALDTPSPALFLGRGVFSPDNRSVNDTHQAWFLNMLALFLDTKVVALTTIEASGTMAMRVEAAQKEASLLIRIFRSKGQSSGFVIGLAQKIDSGKIISETAFPRSRPSEMVHSLTQWLLSLRPQLLASKPVDFLTLMSNLEQNGRCTHLIPWLNEHHYRNAEEKKQGLALAERCQTRAHISKGTRLIYPLRLKSRGIDQDHKRIWKLEAHNSGLTSFLQNTITSPATLSIDCEENCKFGQLSLQLSSPPEWKEPSEVRTKKKIETLGALLLKCRQMVKRKVPVPPMPIEIVLEDSDGAQIPIGLEGAPGHPKLTFPDSPDLAPFDLDEAF